MRLTPHPYVSAGAPYGSNADPFRLRSGVVARLLEAQHLLQQRQSSLRLAIFDAWRPVAVQRYMVNVAIDQECAQRGVDRLDPNQHEALQDVISEVGRFWAPPSDDPSTPPPHSTGAAVDLTLAAVGVNEPGDGRRHRCHRSCFGTGSLPRCRCVGSDSSAALWHGRRALLRGVMESVGFEQHPNEWWHFSHGDQLWAWRSGASQAIYAGAPSSSATA